MPLRGEQDNRQYRTILQEDEQTTHCHQQGPTIAQAEGELERERILLQAYSNSI